jgi:ABC-type glycerol-3-phosphate transport system permease component
MWGKPWKEVERKARPSFMDDFLACTSSARLVISLMSGFVFFQLHSFLWLHYYFFLLVAHMGANEHCAWKCNFHINNHVNINDLHADIIYTSTYFEVPFFVLNLNLHY